MKYLCLTTADRLAGDVDTWWTRIVGDRDVWGPGLSGWNPALSIDGNLAQRIAGYDAVFLSHVFSSGSPAPGLPAGKPSVVFLHEVQTVDPQAPRRPACDVRAIDIVLHAYSQSELDHVYANRALTKNARQLIAHVPHHVRTDLFHEGGGERDIDVLLVGRTSPELYPLRARWARLVAEGHWRRAHHRPAPYDHGRVWTPSELQHQEREYATLLRRAHIVLSCSSHYRYMLQKFTEIAASGAFIISDVANQMPQAFTAHMGVVAHTQLRDFELVRVVNSWLERAQDRQLHTRALSQYVSEHLAMTAFWDKVDAAVHTWRQQ